MRVAVERSGGFACIAKKAAVDSEALSAEDSGELQKLIEAAGIFALPDDAPGDGADQFQYKLTIESALGNRTLVIGDADPARDAAMCCI